MWYLNPVIKFEWRTGFRMYFLYHVLLRQLTEIMYRNVVCIVSTRFYMVHSRFGHNFAPGWIFIDVAKWKKTATMVTIRCPKDFVWILNKATIHSHLLLPPKTQCKLWSLMRFCLKLLVSSIIVTFLHQIIMRIYTTMQVTFSLKPHNKKNNNDNNDNNNNGNNNDNKNNRVLITKSSNSI